MLVFWLVRWKVCCWYVGWQAGRPIAPARRPLALLGCLACTPLSSLMEGWLGHQMSPTETSPTAAEIAGPLCSGTKASSHLWGPFTHLFWDPAANKGEHSEIALILQVCRILHNVEFTIYNSSNIWLSISQFNTVPPSVKKFSFECRWLNLTLKSVKHDVSSSNEIICNSRYGNFSSSFNQGFIVVGIVS